MNKITSIDPDNRMAVVESGVLNQDLQDVIKLVGFFWPPDPSSAAYCSIGGNLATCSAGPHALKYGVDRDHILGLKAVTGNGDIIKTGCYASKGVVGYSLIRLLVGPEGTLAVIFEATYAVLQLCQVAGLIEAKPAHDTKALWSARKALSPLLKDIAPKKINEDIAVPVSHLPALLQGWKNRRHNTGYQM